MSKVVTLKIDNRDISAHDDQTLMDVTSENGIVLPALCHIDGLADVGACRLCLVEVKGYNKLLPACTTMVQEGMEVYTQTERLLAYRRMVIEMLFSENNHVCAVCVSNGHCELQALAMGLGVDHIRLAYRYPRHEVDATHERFAIDHNRCILCTRCVRVCDELEGAHTWDIMGRGVSSTLISDLSTPWGESSTCTSCGKCVQVCPTGALFAKGRAVAEMTRRREFLPYLRLMRGNGSHD